METYISVDIEADGPIPGKNSMLSLGAVAFDPTGQELAAFSENLECLVGAKKDPKTSLWWSKFPDALAAARANARPPVDVMIDFEAWVSRFECPVFVAYPAGFDFTFVHWYFHYFLDHDPFGFSALDLKSYAMALRGTDFRKTTKKRMPKEWTRAPLYFSRNGGLKLIVIMDIT